MRQIQFIIVSIVCFVLTACGPKTSQSYYDYESKIIASEMDGSYTIRAVSRGRNSVDAYNQAQKQAVRDVIFKGVASDTKQIKAIKPLLMEINAEEKYEAYFNKFFTDGGDFEKYITKKERRLWSTRFTHSDVQATAEVTVCVHRNDLRARLIADGILKQ